MKNLPAFANNDKITYTDQYSTRKGTIIEVNLLQQRARIKWDEKRPRTWIRFAALKKILLFILVIMAVSCHKSIDRPTPPTAHGYSLIIHCVSFKDDTLRLSNGVIVPRHLCTQTKIDTLKY